MTVVDEAFRPRVVLVCGSRDWGQPMIIEHYLRQLPHILGSSREQIRIIHGAASRKVGGVEVSADALAAVIAEAMSYEVQAFPADWRPNGVYDARAGFRRNIVMLDQDPDFVLAFQRNLSRGTQHTIDEAKRRGIPVEVYRA